METPAVSHLIAIDIGNSRLKAGRFEPQLAEAPPLPVTAFDLPIVNKTGEFDTDRFIAWCDENVFQPARFAVASVHRGAAERLSSTIADWAQRTNSAAPAYYLTYKNVPLAIRVDEPHRVGIDRLLGALAACHLRRAGCPAIVVDHGTAIKVDLLEADGAFAGGAILPGIAMSSRALAEHTDALPVVAMDRLTSAPAPVGKSTVTAIQSGLHWGAIGAIRELVTKISASLTTPPDVFVTGGASPPVAELLTASGDWAVRHVPHLVLAGIALADAHALNTADR